MNALEARNPTRAINKSMDPDCKYEFVHSEDINQFVDQCHGVTVLVEEQNNLSKQKVLLIVEWIHKSSNPKPLQAPKTVHDVCDHAIQNLM
jgi:hypothetical protein